MKNVRNILWGLLLIAAGVLIGIDTFGIYDINFFFDGWWTLFIIVPCTIDLFKSKDRTFNFIGIAVGLILLLACQEIITFEILLKLIVPVILVVLGLSLIFKDAVGGKAAKEIKRLNDIYTSRKNVGAVFSTERISVDNEVLESMDISASFGSVKCNFENAVVNYDVVLNINATFGSVEIYAPKGVKVVVKSTSIFGSASDKTENAQQDPNMPKIYVNAVCMFGGVQII